MEWHEELHRKLNEVLIQLDSLVAVPIPDSENSSVEIDNDLSAPTGARG